MAGPYDEEPRGPDDRDLQAPNLTEEMRLGLAAQALLDSEAYSLVMDQMRANILTGFRTISVQDEVSLRYIKLMDKVVQDFEVLLTDTAGTGKMAAIQLTEQQEPATRIPITDEGVS